MSRAAALALLLLGTLCLVPVGADGEPLAERDWQEVSSGNFRIKSVLDDAETIELLRHLEVMRASLGDTSAVSTYESQVPTIILAVDSHEDYVAIGAPDFSAGYFISDLRENAILVEHTRGAEGTQIILHEYAHYLNKQSGRIRFPRWFEEGNAEYLSHSRIRDQAFEYALPPRGHLAALAFMSWMPLPELLAVDDTLALSAEKAALFYGQSWLLVHYLRSLPDADQTLAARLGHYARLASAGTLPSEAFAEAFAVDLEAFEQSLLQYYLNGEFASRSVAVNTALPDFAPRVAKLSSAEAQLALAHMALRFENFDAAESWFTAVLEDNELRAHAEAGLGRILGKRGDVDGANKHFETAIYLMAWDFRIWMDYAQYRAQQLSTSYDSASRQKAASRLIEALRNALTISDATPELNSLMGLAYLATGKDVPEAIQYLEAAIEAAPHDQATRMLLARAYLFVFKPNDAIAVAESVLQFEHQANALTDAARDVINDARELRRQMN
jgi:tetratricopeptide (TPR) repeat protein